MVLIKFCFRNFKAVDIENRGGCGSCFCSYNFKTHYKFIKKEYNMFMLFKYQLTIVLIYKCLAIFLLVMLFFIGWILLLVMLYIGVIFWNEVTLQKINKWFLV